MSIRLKNKEEFLENIYTMDELRGQKFSSQEFFNNDHPVVLDAGCGKGEFLLQHARSAPEINFIGVDYSWKKCLFSQKKLVLNDIKNVMIIRAAFEELFPVFFDDETFIRVHMNFPDPWPKVRHHKRRSLQTALVAEYVRMLKPQGDFYFVTDHREYAEYAYPVIKANENLRDQLDGIQNTLDGYLDTLFHSKAQEVGSSINYLWFQKQ